MNFNPQTFSKSRKLKYFPCFLVVLVIFSIMLKILHFIGKFKPENLILFFIFQVFLEKFVEAIDSKINKEKEKIVLKNFQENFSQYKEKEKFIFRGK